MNRLHCWAIEKTDHCCYKIHSHFITLEGPKFFSVRNNQDGKEKGEKIWGIKVEEDIIFKTSLNWKLIDMAKQNKTYFIKDFSIPLVMPSTLWLIIMLWDLFIFKASSLLLLLYFYVGEFTNIIIFGYILSFRFLIEAP